VGGRYSIIHHGVRGNDSIDVLKCNDCGLVWLSEFITDDQYYENSGMRSADVEQTTKQIRVAAKKDDQRRYKFIRNLIENRVLLDFGCGVGGVLQYARDDAETVYGVELEKKMCKTLEQEGIRCFQSLDLAEKELTGKVDVVTMFHVLEHLADPVKMLKRLKMLLKPGGVMVIEIPNAEDALLSLYKSKPFADFTYWEDHLYLYNNFTFSSLMKMANLKIRFLGQIQRYSLSNTMYWLSKSKPGGHKVWTMLSDEKLDEEYGKKLSELGIADTIIAIVE